MYNGSSNTIIIIIYASIFTHKDITDFPHFSVFHFAQYHIVRPTFPGLNRISSIIACYAPLSHCYYMAYCVRVLQLALTKYYAIFVYIPTATKKSMAKRIFLSPSLWAAIALWWQLE